ncbi:tRNA pseudouridine(65) synthase TruC [Pasteurellaceae bacterium HPA106]|uniref:tRNA pseudouridine(65) synthase TruC n=1 Tax=Spirabiliibacterium pneumoniae TaxID=221400 RepID=UPI001AAC93A6|nr:tRNA pseudouridine(65) synthase TruC [Spirabiliibacterium pneumoniae]MBE2896555.1 tRNA pseudouridine(65) synthase TruC [Spirabiliibacterium pneumoniae]
MTATIDIIYQDDAVVVVNKPANMLVHRSWLDRHESTFLMQTLRDQIGQHVYTIHRLDRPTSGVMVFGLNPSVARQLSEQFEQKTIKKNYLALVRGYLTGEGRVDYALSYRHDKIADKFARTDKPAQEAVSDYTALLQAEMPFASNDRYPTSRYTLVQLNPQTGRKHQLRRHMKHLRHPIIGDTVYGDLRQNRTFAQHIGVNGLMLHASQIHFIHPTTGKVLICQAGLDMRWQHALEALGMQSAVCQYAQSAVTG